MKSWRSTAKDLVPRKQRRLGIYRQPFEPAFFSCLPHGRGLEVLVAGFQVTARLQPPAEAGMQSQQHLLRRRGANQRTRRQMHAWAVSRPAIRIGRKMINVQPTQPILLARGRPPLTQRTDAAVCQGEPMEERPGALT